MLAAVLTLTRDRLSYTQHCFDRLRSRAGMEFHHYVLDQDSKDGTGTWLENEQAQGRIKYLYHAGMNVGIARGMNHLVEKAMRHGAYDAIVKFDNDCELLQHDTLARAVQVSVLGAAVVSPIVDGLERPPLQIGPKSFVDTAYGTEAIKEMPQIGGIFMATPYEFWGQFRYPEDLPNWGGDDTFLCQYARNEDYVVGYIENLRVNHYRTTEGQHSDFPSYFLRRQGEGGPP